MSGIRARALNRELKRGSAELLILSLLDMRPRHGDGLSKLIQTRSGGQLTCRRVLAQQRRAWDAFVAAVRRVTEPEHA